MNHDQELEKLRAELKELQARYDFLLSAVDHLPNPIFMKDADARFFFFNKAYSDFFGMKREDYVGKTVLDLDYLPMDDRQRFQREDLKRIADTDIISYNTSFAGSDGVDHPSFYWSRGFHDDVSGRNGLCGEIVDITNERKLQKALDQSNEELKSANESLRVMAETDYASGLYNRAALWDKGEKMVLHTCAAATRNCMVMFDLDNFKEINDDFGHLEGDRILAEFASIMRSECRTTDLPFRYGGDEFLAILGNVNLTDGIKVADRIRTRCKKELMLPGGRAITVSVGIIEVDETASFEKNLSRLDDHLYKAKALGRNQIVSAL